MSTADDLSTLSSCAVYPEFEGVYPTIPEGETKNYLIEPNPLYHDHVFQITHNVLI